jgi:hypothetical protein
MVMECILLKSNNEFIYRWKSDLLFVEEYGKWSRSGDMISISTNDQPSDYIQINREKSVEEVDSVSIKYINEDFEDKSFINLVKHSKDTIIEIPFDKEGILKIELDTINEFGTDAIYTPWQYKFKLKPKDKAIELEVKLMDKHHRTFFDNEKLLIKLNKVYWNDKYEYHWEEVDIELFERRFRKKR